MGKVSFDLGALVSAAGQFESAGEQSAAAGQQLSAASVSGGAFGSAAAGSALAGALVTFGQQHAAGAGKIAQAHQAFAGRLRTTAAIGEQSIDASSAAAT